MAVTIAFIGLDKVGLSTALALAGQSQEIQLKGWDPDLEARVAADRFKIFKPVCKRSEEALRGANLVFMSLVADDIRPTLESLKNPPGKGIPVIALTSQHAQMHAWVNEILGAQWPFISLYPLTNLDVTRTADTDQPAGAEDFENCAIYIADVPDVPPAMLDLAVDIAVIMGGRPVLISPNELDGLISANVLMPQMAAAVIMKMAADQPSWRYEGQAVAGQALIDATRPLLDLKEGEISGLMSAGHRGNLERLLNDLIRHFSKLRDDLNADKPERLSAFFNDVFAARSAWLTGEQKSGKQKPLVTSLPDKKDSLKRLLKLGGRG